VFKIIHAEFLSPGIKRFVIEAPRIARRQKPGQFVILRIYEEGERIPEMRAVSDALTITTDDGSFADRGFVTDKLRQLIDNGTRIDMVVAVGPIVMMKTIAELTRKEKIHTVVSLNPIMMDGTGMCGGCRVLIDGKSEFACVDGPEFDAHASTSLCWCSAIPCTAMPSSTP